MYPQSSKGSFDVTSKMSISAQPQEAQAARSPQTALGGMTSRIRRLALVAAIFACCCSWLPLTAAYETGAPVSACLPLLPDHEGKPQPLPSPYRIEVNSRGNEVHVELVGNEPFRGFLINARLASNPDRIVPGTFAAGVDPNTQTLACVSEPNSGLTHISGDDKISIRAVWTPPPNFNDRVIFMGAVVRTFDRFWSRLRSAEVVVRGTGVAGGAARGAAGAAGLNGRPPLPDQVYDNCGRTEGCFGLPANCVGGSRRCDVVLGYREEPGYGYFFQMVTSLGPNKYVAAGLSHDNLMGDDAVVECIDVAGNLDIRESWNVGGGYKSNEVQPLANVQKVAQASTDGVHTCQWRRRYVTKVKGRTYNLRDGFYVLLAVGGVRDNGDKRRHEAAVASSGPVDFSVLGIERGDDSALWVKIHATLMLVAWLFTASLGMLLARHFKHVWEDRMPCGVQMWFALHRGFMVLTLVLSIAGVGVMLYRFGIFTSQAGLHPIFGLVSVVLCICQPVMALFRCHPGTKYRPLFNWVHWFVGNAAQIAGVVAIFLAIDLPKASLQTVPWFIWLVVAFVVFHVLCHFILQIHGFSVDRKVSAAVTDVHMQPMGASNANGPSAAAATSPPPPAAALVETKDSPGSDFRRFMLGLYIVGLLFIVGAMLAVVWLNDIGLLLPL